ncbi:unnamed protein product [Linum tenue]|nr:unnamed protein product [Linum tenue]
MLASGSAAAVPPTTWVWNPRGGKTGQDEEDENEEESWEVKAFEEDAGNIMGSTWPPRSYTCTFCRREFRSAQALGGHMNVHRRDRAKLHHHHHQTLPPPPPPPPNPTTNPSSASSPYIIPSTEFSTAAGGLCLLYQFPNPNTHHHAAAAGGGYNTAISSAATNACTTADAPSTLLSMAPYAQHRHNRGQSRNPYPPPRRNNSSSSPPQYYDFGGGGGGGQLAAAEGNDKEEVDLELRLGQRSTSSSSSA